MLVLNNSGQIKLYETMENVVAFYKGKGLFSCKDAENLINSWNTNNLPFERTKHFDTWSAYKTLNGMRKHDKIKRHGKGITAMYEAL